MVPMNRSRALLASILAVVPAIALAAALALILSLLTFAGCSERDLSTLAPVPGNTDPLVFDDDFGSGVDYQAFAGSNTSEGIIAVDTAEKYQGTASLHITVPGPGDPAGVWVGGAFVASDFRDLSGYDALTFYARASVASSLNVAGFGNDNTGTSLYEASRADIPITTQWARVVIPIPRPEVLDHERGLFYLAEAYENNAGFDLWLDEIRFERLGTIDRPRPAMASKTVDGFIGSTVSLDDTRTTFRVGVGDVLVNHMPSYFTFSSSDPAVAVVRRGAVDLLGGGDATITAKLDTVTVDGEVTVDVLAPPASPAPTPVWPPADVISLFSDAYEDVPVDTWNAHWSGSTAEVSDYEIAGDDVKLITDLNFLGIEFLSHKIDASAMTHFHMDVWAPSGTNFRVKLIAFNASGVFIGQAELTFDAASDPAFVPGQWSRLEAPLADFQLAAPRDNLGQMALSTDDARTVFVDNVYFHK